jgi:hypothetical protein
MGRVGRVMASVLPSLGCSSKRGSRCKIKHLNYTDGSPMLRADRLAACLALCPLARD